MNLNNFVQLVGHYGETPVNKGNDESKPFTSFSFATNNTFKDATGQRVERVSWHNCVAYGNIAQSLIKHQAKGDKALIHGALQYRTYENKEGKTIYVTEIIVDSVQFLTAKNTDNAN